MRIFRKCNALWLFAALSLTLVFLAGQRTSAIAFAGTAAAAEEPESGSAGEAEREFIDGSVVRIRAELSYEGKVLQSRHSTGCFISTNQSEVYVASARSAAFTEAEIDEWEAEIKEGSEEALGKIKVDERYEIVFGGDIRAAAEPIEIESPQRELIVLKCSGVREPEGALKIAGGLDALDSVRVAGFGKASDEADIYDSDSAAVFYGEVAKTADEKDRRFKIAFFTDGGYDDETLIGAPVLNEEGRLVGVYMGADEHLGTAVAASNLVEMLKLQGIEASEEKGQEQGRTRSAFIYIIVYAAAAALVFTSGKLIFDWAAGLKRRHDVDADGFERPPVLLRINTNEKFPIDKELYCVGSDADKCGCVVDLFEKIQFCVVRDRGKYCAVRVGKRDSVSVNGKKIKANTKVRLRDKAALYCNGEKFVYMERYD